MTVPPVPANLPVIMTQAGPQPTPPGTINATIILLASAQSPGLTADLPGLLIEDIASTATYAAVLQDQARVETINSLTWLGANEFLLNQQGQQAGLMLGQPTNTSAEVVFTVTASSVPQSAFVIPPGFMVTDGTNGTYLVIDGGLTNSEGVTPSLTVIAVNPGAWPVPAGSISIVQTSISSPFVVTCTNPIAGTSGQVDPEGWSSYRTRVLTAGQASAIGMPSFIKTKVAAVTAVTLRSVSVQTPSTGGILVLSSGGDEYQTAYAIYRGAGDITNLVPSVNQVTGFTLANPGVATTALYHGLGSAGDVAAGVVIAGSDPTNFNGTYTVTIINDYSFSVGINTSGYPAYVGSAICETNPRNAKVTIQDLPDQYPVPVVTALQQVVTGSVTWNTNLPDFVQGAAVDQAIPPALATYVNGLLTSQQMNQFEMNAAIQAATANILPNQNLTRLVYTVIIDGAEVSLDAGTSIYPSDSQSFLTASSNAFSSSQG